MIEFILTASLLLLIISIYVSISAKKIIGDQLQGVNSTVGMIEKDLLRIEAVMRDESARNRDEFSRNAKEAREELAGSFNTLGESILMRMSQMTDVQKGQLETFSLQLASLTKTNEDKIEKLISAIEAKFDTIARRQGELTKSTEEKLEKMRESLETRLKIIQDDNSDKLEKIRATVDEKLHKTLEERLGESFKIVSERLEHVHRGLGEMQTLAAGVGDLKKVLSNVKTRGILGEYQLESILEQILAPEQYAKNVCTKSGSRDQVEFAIKLPGGQDRGTSLWLPVDSKFHQEKYLSLLDAYDKAVPETIEQASKELEKSIKAAAKDIRDKYLDPPDTTDFGIMFLPFEGLYAEVVRRPDLLECIHREFRVSITGPSTLAAFLNSLQMGFKTLAIQKRSSEVWNLLGAVKTEFGRFGSYLDGIQEHLEKASKKIQAASSRTRTIERKLKDVEALPADNTDDLLETDPEFDKYQP